MGSAGQQLWHYNAQQEKPLRTGKRIGRVTILTNQSSGLHTTETSYFLFRKRSLFADYLLRFSCFRISILLKVSTNMEAKVTVKTLVMVNFLKSFLTKFLRDILPKDVP